MPTKSIYHSDPKVTKLLLSFRTLDRGNPYSHLSKEQIASGALLTASNKERQAFFAHSWVLMGNMAAYIYFVGIILTGFRIMIDPWQLSFELIAMFAVPVIIGSALAGVSFRFHRKIAQCTSRNTDKPIIFTKHEMLRPSLIGGIYGICFTALFIGIMLYASANPETVSYWLS